MTQKIGKLFNTVAEKLLTKQILLKLNYTMETLGSFPWHTA